MNEGFGQLYVGIVSQALNKLLISFEPVNIEISRDQKRVEPGL